MTSIFDLLVLAAFFAPMAILVASNLATYRPGRAGLGLIDSPMAIAPRPEPQPADERVALEEMREAA